MTALLGRLLNRLGHRLVRWGYRMEVWAWRRSGVTFTYSQPTDVKGPSDGGGDK